MFIHYSLLICNARNLCSHRNRWIHSIFYCPAMTQGCNTFFSHTAALYEQSKLQHPAMMCSERQNTDHAVAGPQMGLSRGSSRGMAGSVPISGTSGVLLLQLTSVKDCWCFGSARAALVTPGKGLACCSSQQHPFSIPFLLTSSKIQTEGRMQVILFLLVPNVNCDAHFPKHGCILALLQMAVYIFPPARLAGSKMQVPHENHGII